MDLISIINQINDIGWHVVIICAILLLSLIVAAIVGIKKLLSTLGLRTESSIEKEQIMKRLDKMQEEIDTFKSDRVHDRAQSFDKQKELTSRQEDISNSLEKIINQVDMLSQTMADIQEKNDFKERAKLKDRISQSYRYFHKEQKWTSMDKEAFDDLIRSYEASGGSNSFVHSICEPESLTWEVIDD